MIPREADVGVVVGRFQVHRLHEGQRELLDAVSKAHRQMIVVLGLSAARVSINNPLDFEARKQMLLAEYPLATVLYLKDEPLDSSWSARLDRLLDDVLTPAQSVVLYGSRDSFIAHYGGSHQTHVMEPSVYASGAEIRRSISRAVKGTEDFRAGVIWATANGWPKVFPAVDVAVLKFPEREPDVRQVLLVSKPHELLRWRFPGGFAQPTDASWEAAARREVAEETGASIDGLRYVGSFNVDDWRYRSEADKIVTTLFAATYVSGPVCPADDVSEARWFDLVGQKPTLVPEHEPLWNALMKQKDGGQ